MLSRRWISETRAAAGFDHDVHRVVVERIFLFAFGQSLRGAELQQFRMELRLGDVLEELADVLDFLVVDERALRADHAAAGGLEHEHVALTQQQFAAGLVEHDAGVEAAERTWKQMRPGMLDLMRPVTTCASGRCVARIRWIPTARAFWAMRTMCPSTSLLVIIRSASSSMMITMYGMWNCSLALSSSVLALKRVDDFLAR